MIFPWQILLGAAISLVSINVSAQKFSERQAAIAEHYLSQDAMTFKSGGGSVIGRLLDVVRTTPHDLRKTYSDNEVAGDQKFFNKSLFVSAKVARINSGPGNRPYLTLVDGDSFSNTQASFKKPDVERIAKLRKGQNLLLVCIGGGSVMGAPLLRDCEFVDDAIEKEVSGIRKQIALAQAGEGNFIGNMLWFMIETVDSYLPRESKCGVSQVVCVKEIAKVEKLQAFNKAVEEKRKQIQD